MSSILQTGHLQQPSPAHHLLPRNPFSLMFELLGGRGRANRTTSFGKWGNLLCRYLAICHTHTPLHDQRPKASANDLDTGSVPKTAGLVQWKYSLIPASTYAVRPLQFSIQTQIKQALVISATSCGALFGARTTPQPSQNLVEPSWNPGGTLVEPSWNLISGSPRTTPEPIWAETPKLSAVEKYAFFI